MKKYKVTYYSRRDKPNKPVEKGGGVWTRTFTDPEVAQAFADEHQVYGKPCTVKEVEEEEDER